MQREKMMFKGLRADYSPSFYFVYEGLIWVKAGRKSVPVDSFLGVERRVL